MLKYILISLSFLFAQAPINISEKDQDLSAWTQAILDADYALAHSKIKSLKGYKDYPLDSLFLALTYIVEFDDLGKPNIIEQAEAILETLSKEHEFWGGLAQFKLGYVQGLTGSPLSSLFGARKGAARLETQTQNLDALALYSVYAFYSSKMGSWVPFVKDESKQAIATLEKGVAQSRYFAPFLANSLCWLYYEEKRYDKMEELARSMSNRYPKNRLFKQILGDALRFQKRYPEAIAIYQASEQAYAKHYKGIRYYSAVGNLYLLASLTKDATGVAKYKSLWEKGLAVLGDTLPETLRDEIRDL